MLGRYEYQKGNIEAALHVFEGIDISAVTPKMKVTLAQRAEPHRKRSQNYATPPMSIHAASLLLEAIFLKAKSLQALGRYKGIFFIAGMFECFEVSWPNWCSNVCFFFFFP